LGIDSSLTMGYGFIIPEACYERLLPRDDECPEYFTGDDIYTHEMSDGIYIFGKIFYETEARCYLWDGNREVVDVKEALKIHYMVKKKIDRIADECGQKANYFVLTEIT